MEAKYLQNFDTYKKEQAALLLANCNTSDDCNEQYQGSSDQKDVSSE